MTTAPMPIWMLAKPSYWANSAPAIATHPLERASPATTIRSTSMPTDLAICGLFPDARMAMPRSVRRNSRERQSQRPGEQSHERQLRQPASAHAGPEQRDAFGKCEESAPETLGRGHDRLGGRQGNVAPLHEEEIDRVQRSTGQDSRQQRAHQQPGMQEPGDDSRPDTGHRRYHRRGDRRRVQHEKRSDDRGSQRERAVHGEVERVVHAIADEDAEGERCEDEAHRHRPDQQIHGPDSAELGDGCDPADTANEGALAARPPSRGHPTGDARHRGAADWRRVRAPGRQVHGALRQRMIGEDRGMKVAEQPLGRTGRTNMRGPRPSGAVGDHARDEGGRHGVRALGCEATASPVPRARRTGAAGALIGGRSPQPRSAEPCGLPHDDEPGHRPPPACSAMLASSESGTASASARVLNRTSWEIAAFADQPRREHRAWRSRRS